MRRAFLSLLAFCFAAVMTAQSYGILVNGYRYFTGTRNEHPISDYFTEYMCLGVPLNVGDKVKLYDQTYGASWVVPLDQASTSALTLSGSEYNCSTAGCYDFYIKLHYNEDQLYVGAASGTCTDWGMDIGTGGGDTGSNCNDGPYGIEVNGTDLYEANPTGEEDYDGRVQYMASVQLNVGDEFVIINRSCDVRWSEDVETYGAGRNFSGGKAAGKVVCDVAGCYDIYVKMKMDDNILYIGEGENCGDPIDPGTVIPERPSYAKSVPERCPDVMLQVFYYDSYKDANDSHPAPGNVTINGRKLGDTKWSTLLANSEEIGMYFDMVWLPPSGKSSGGTGYHQRQYSNQNSDWGTKTELVEFINRMHKADTKVIADIVINHAGAKSTWCDFFTQYFNPYGTFRPDATWICKTDEMNSNPDAGECQGAATGSDDGGYNGQDNYGSAPDWAHADTRVQTMMKAYLRWMKNVMGFDGWRYDYAQGFKGRYIDMYNSASANYFSVCEFWNTNVKGYLGDCNWNTTVFDFGNKYAAINRGIADHHYNQCMGSGLQGTGDGRYAVTFVDNHDTYFGCADGREDQSEIGGCGNSMKDSNKWRVLAANAYILSRPGVPCVFWPHWVKYKSDIKKMVMARQAVGIHSESTCEDESGADNSYYKVTVNGTNGKIRLLIGPNSGWDNTPSGYTLVCKSNSGADTPFGMYYQLNSAETPRVTLTPSQKFKTSTFTVTIEAAALTGTPAIYYTTDGSDPTTTSTRYTSAFTINATTTVKAIAVLNGHSSPVMESTYTYKEPQTTPIVVRFAYDETWEGNVYVHTWGTGTNTGGWPGRQLTVGTDGWYTYQFPASATEPNFIFNNGGRGVQTGDLKTDCDVCYRWKNGCEEMDEDCAQLDMDFSVILTPTDTKFRDNVAGLDVTATAVGVPEGETVTMYYTLDGTTPTTSSPSKTENPATFNFKETTVLKVLAVAGNKRAQVVQATYTYKAPQTTPFVVKFYNSASWRKVNAWAWDASDASINYTGGTWPGQQITDDDNDGWFVFTYPEVLSAAYIIFNNGTDQTQDIFVDEDACYVWIVADKKAGYSATCSPDDTPVERVEISDKEIPVLDFNAPAYNVLGQRVDAHYKGIIIQNGHKFLVR